MTNEKKRPQRKCLGCGEMTDKSALVRIVRSPEGEVSLDLTGRKSGRGAYICRKPDCLQKARKAHRAEKALSCAIPEEVYDKMEEELRQNG